MTMGSDNVRLMCPNLKCRTILSVPAVARGRSVRCRACGARVNVPPADKPRAPEPEAAEAGKKK